jgi:hypothetical protein
MTDMDLIWRLRDIGRNPPNLHERQRIADEIERLQRELTEALGLMREARWVILELGGGGFSTARKLLDRIDAADRRLPRRCKGG